MYYDVDRIFRLWGYLRKYYVKKPSELSCGCCFFKAYVALMPQQINLRSTIEKTIDDSGNEIAKETNYFYDNPFPNLLTRTIQTISDGKELVTHILYPNDYANTGGYNFIGYMKREHIINKPIEIVKYKQDVGGGNLKIISGSVNTYKTQTDLLDKTWNLETNSPIAESDFKFSNRSQGEIPPNEGSNISFSKDLNYYQIDPNLSYSYDKGNVVQEEKQNDIATSYIWGYNNSYPIIKAENIEYSDLEIAVNDVLSAISLSLDELLSNVDDMSNQSQRDLWDDFNDALRNHALLNDVMINTYTYVPLVGMTSESDQNGISTYYEYDDFGRLIRVLNNDDDVLEENIYHFASQEGGEPDMLLVGPDLSFDCSYLGSSKAFSISSNLTWTVTSSESWVGLSSSIGSGNGRLTVICPENAGTSMTATVTIQANGISHDIIITQDDGPHLNISPDLLFSCDYESASKTYTVSSNISWEVTKSTGDDWIQLSNTTGQDNGSFNITCTQNNGSQRSGTVTVEGGDFTREIRVVQYKRPPFFELGPNLSFVCNYQADSKTFNVSSNVYWSITKSAGDDWIQLSHHLEQGSGSFNITCTENDNAQRTGTVTVAGEGFSYDITVFQYSYPISVNPTSHTFESSGGNKTFLISPDGNNISAFTNESWLTIVSVTSKTVTVTCSDIKTLPSRSGSIKIYGEPTPVDSGIEPQNLTIDILQLDENGMGELPPH